MYHDENDATGMQNILKYLHQYVTYAAIGTKREYLEQGVVGDQLTIERGVNGLMGFSNDFTPEERREGLYLEVADFHAHMKFLQVQYIIIKCYCT